MMKMIFFALAMRRGSSTQTLKLQRRRGGMTKSSEGVNVPFTRERYSSFNDFKSTFSALRSSAAIESNVFSLSEEGLVGRLISSMRKSSSRTRSKKKVYHSPAPFNRTL